MWTCGVTGTVHVDCGVTGSVRVDLWASILVVSNVTFHFLVTVATKIINVPLLNIVCLLYACARLDSLCLVNELWQLIRCCCYIRVCCSYVKVYCNYVSVCNSYVSVCGCLLFCRRQAIHQKVVTSSNRTSPRGSPPVGCPAAPCSDTWTDCYTIGLLILFHPSPLYVILLWS
jgi:hypothetical protein